MFERMNSGLSNMQDLAERADCVLRHLRQAPKASSQQGEDYILLPTLLRMAAGAPGVFVELGALDGRNPDVQQHHHPREVLLGIRDACLPGNI